MTKDAMERPKVKLEIPLPRWPSSPKIRFGLKTLLVLIAGVAAALAIHTHARNAERQQHCGGYFSLFVAMPDGSNLTTLQCADHNSVEALVRSSGFSIGHSDFDTATLWPPRIWIERPDSTSPNLKRTIFVECDGTKKDPKFDDEEIKLGDSIFIDFRSDPIVGSNTQIPMTK